MSSHSVAEKKKKAQCKQNAPYLAIDLFAGCGGLTLGLKQAGFKVVGAVESDELSLESYEKNHVGTHLWKRDIRTLSTLSVKRTLKLKKGQLDLLAGCPPCQGFSTLVTKNGCYLVDDPRNSLIYEFLRFVEDLLPRVVLMENVPDLARTTRFRRFLKRLENLGYKSDYRILDAADYGVPQRRRRLVLLASLNNGVGFAGKARRRYSVREAFKKLTAKQAKSDPLHDTKSKHRTEKIQRLIERIPKNGGSRSDIKRFRQLRCHADFDGFYDIYGRMSWDDISPTITSGCINPSKGRFLHPSKNRPITLREAALLQTFPKSYWISLSKGKYRAAELVGNAFPPEFARRQAVVVRRHLSDSDG